MISSTQPAIACVEDDADLLRVITKYLRSEGFRTKGYPDARAFLESPDLNQTLACIVSDIRLPGMDGIELVQHLRRIGSRIPIILITGHGDVPLAVSAIKVGANDFLEKPVDPLHLLSVIEHLIARAPVPIAPSLEIGDARRKLIGLSRRQQDVLRLVVSGMTSKEIGLRLGLTHGTVDNYRSVIMEKLEADSLSDLIRLQLLADQAAADEADNNK